MQCLEIILPVSARSTHLRTGLGIHVRLRVVTSALAEWHALWLISHGNVQERVSRARATGDARSLVARLVLSCLLVACLVALGCTVSVGSATGTLSVLCNFAGTLQARVGHPGNGNTRQTTLARVRRHSRAQEDVLQVIILVGAQVVLAVLNELRWIDHGLTRGEQL